MATSLGPLEMRVLGLLDADARCSVADVRARLREQGHAAAYTTVMTVLTRLYDKGLVRRDKEGPRYVYRTTARAARVKTETVKSVQRSLFGDRLAPIAALLDEGIDRQELQALRRLVEEKLREESDEESDE